MQNTRDSARRPLGVNESVAVLVSAFGNSPPSEIFPGLTKAQELVLQVIGRELVNSSQDFLGPDAVPGEFLPPVICEKAEAMMRMMNRDHVSTEVAVRTFFGPTATENMLEFPPLFSGVHFYIIAPHAMRLLDPSQSHVVRAEDFSIPKDWVNWALPKAGLSRICVASGESLKMLLDHIKIFGGTPHVIALVGVDPNKEDVLPKGKSYLFEIELLEYERLYRMEYVPEGLGDFYKQVTLGKSCFFLEQILNLLTLRSYYK